MNHYVNDEVPEGWNHIIESFLTVVDHDVRLSQGVPIDEVEFMVRHNALSIAYSGGNKTTDAYAMFAQIMSTNTCTDCGTPATRRIFESPKCDNCF